uniref:TNF receptor superfamily member 10b n=1 Tax=Aquila chrysaetos chrysaetos TaxID=223781 RepID=A0A663ECV3_AQUCH
PRGLAVEASLGAAAATLNRRDKLDTLDRKPCKKQNASSKCLPCKENEYIEYPNDFPKCLGCRTCREDQVELSPCQAVRDTQCACKNGTFCSPDHPCEMCQKCRPRCPKGEVELAPCTPHSDRQCGPPTGTFSGSSNNLIMTILLVVIGIMLVLVLILWRCSLPSRDHSTRLVCAFLPPQDYLLRQLTRYRRGGLGTQDNIRNERFSRDQLLPRAPGLVTPTFWAKCILTQLCVLYPDWKRFGRALDLLENDIALAEMNDKYSLEPFFQMLNMWQNRQGMNASVNTLLETLHQINLGGIAEDISSKLVQQGSFQYEVS